MRLTNNIRHTILTAVMRDTFTDREVKIDNELVETGLLCRDKLLGEYRDTILALPQKMVCTEYTLIVVIDGQRRRLPLNLEGLMVPCPSIDCVLDRHDPLAKRVIEITKKHETLNDEKHILKSEIRQLLASVSTINKLVVIWPEVKPFIPIEAPETKALMVQPQAINRKIKKAKL